MRQLASHTTLFCSRDDTVYLVKNTDARTESKVRQSKDCKKVMIHAIQMFIHSEQTVFHSYQTGIHSD